MDSNALELDRKNARRIIDQLGGAGQPPSYGIEFFSVGLEEYLTAIDEDYLSTFIKDGGSAFKMVVGVYGGGKTHFLYSIRDLAWKYNFAVSYVSLKSSGECPFHQLDLVYKAIVNGLVPPLPSEELADGHEAGISSFLKTCYSRKYQNYFSQGFSKQEISKAILEEIRQIETSSVSFAHAIRAALSAYLSSDIPTFEAVCQWLKGEGFDKRSLARHQILQKIDKTTAFQMIRSLGQSVTRLGYSGLIILLDEAERVPSLSSKQKEQHLSNLREIIDECGHRTFDGMMLFYAVPDANFLDGKTMVYEALKQRVSTTFTTLNPTGVRIELEKAVPEPIPFLHKVGLKLSRVYEVAYACQFDPSECETLVSIIAEWAYEQRYQDEGYKRLFVQKLIPGLRFLDKKREIPSLHDLE